MCISNLCETLKDVSATCLRCKEFIRLGLRSELRKLEAKYGYDGITVSTKKTVPCTFKPSARRGMIRIPFEDLCDIMEFALDSTLMRGVRGA